MGFRTSIRWLAFVCLLAGGVASCSKTSKPATKSSVRVSGAEVSAAAFKVTKPVAAATYVSSESEIRIEGGCDRGSTISISSTPPESVRCADGTFSFLVSQSADGIYDFVLSQTTGPDTVTRNFQWKRDAAVPAPPTITTPSTNPFISNTATIAIKGTCTPLHSVKVSGLPVPLLKCSDRSVFSSFVAAPVDGTYELKLTQKSPTGVDSEAGTFTWVRDTKSPDPVKITTANPFRGTQHYLALTGTCEPEATLIYDGAFQGQTPCTNGTFSIPLEAKQDTTFQIALAQYDRAGNFSTGTGFTWIKEKSNPVAPRLTSPTLNPLENNQSPILLRGTCDTGHQVQISGGASGTYACNNLQFLIPLEASTDGTRSYSLIQIDPSNNRSVPTAFSWKLDTVVPEPPSVISPNPGSYISAASKIEIKGKCETDAQVELSGAVGGRITCAAGSFAFTLNAAKTVCNSTSSVRPIRPGTARNRTGPGPRLQCSGSPSTVGSDPESLLFEPRFCRGERHLSRWLENQSRIRRKSGRLRFLRDPILQSQFKKARRWPVRLFDHPDLCGRSRLSRYPVAMDS